LLTPATTLVVVEMLQDEDCSASASDAGSRIGATGAEYEKRAKSLATK
jgi:hypothetical protein